MEKKIKISVKKGIKNHIKTKKNSIFNFSIYICYSVKFH